MKGRKITPSRYLQFMDRRSFLAASLTLAAVGSIPLIAIKENEFKNTSQILEKLVSTMRDRESAIEVGKVILNEQDAALPLPELVVSIMNNLDLSFDKLSTIKRADLISRLKHRTVLDFDSGAIVSAAGWMLGQTEARLCALAAKTQASTLFRSRLHL